MAGVAVGLGVLAKYTMIIWLPSLVLFLLISADHRRLLWSSGLWLMIGMVVALGCLPILIWNVHHNWVSFRHVSGLAGLSQDTGSRWHLEGPLVYLATQFGLLLGYWFVAWACALGACAPWRESNPSRRYLWCMSAPMFALFLCFSVRTGGGEPNWPVTAYLSGILLAIGWLLPDGETEPTSQFKSLGRRNLPWISLVGLALIVFVHRSDLCQAPLAWVGRKIQPHNLFPLRVADPTCRLRGWRDLAAEVDRLRDEIRRSGREPVLAAASWALPGELGVYCAGHPDVYCFGPYLGGRRSQYDFWRPNPEADPEQFRGRDFIVVGGMSAAVREAFEEVGPAIEVVHRSGQEPIGSWAIYVCRGFRGFSTPTLEKY
jgi:hypothetical protein